MLEARRRTRESTSWAAWSWIGAPQFVPIDSNGNLAQKAEGSDIWVYTWNAANQLTKVEKRKIQQVVLTDPSKESFFKPGTSFLDDVKAAGLTATDFGLQAKADVVDPAVADAAFALAKEGDFAIIPGIAITLIVLAVNFLASWLRVVSDPVEREKRHAAGSISSAARAVQA